MTVAGIMSGTSADGIDVAIVRIRPRTARLQPDAGPGVQLDLLHHTAVPFSRALRQAVLTAAGTGPTSTADLARLHWRLGLAYAEAAQAAVQASSASLDLVGCHGQTVYHQGRPQRTLGRSFACTWQIGEVAPLARVLAVPVVSNFRPADMACGGHGAPLVPLLDYALYRHPTRVRVLQNLGGIGNLTLVPARATLSDVRAFDTGPGNMLIDALTQQLYGRAYDRDGRLAARGKILPAAVRRALGSPFFLKPPPKSAGREEFGRTFAAAFLAHCQQFSADPADAIASATALTVESIGLAFRTFVRPFIPNEPVDYLVAGGGAKNPTLLTMLRGALEPLGCKVSTTAASALPVDAKEAAAFALLAYQTWHHRPGNVPSATGADRPAILGQVSYA
ncbi:MAG TPA: anhydro-N-acetylmuramic acid kinase [Acidobacteriaceae bacterium]